MEAEVSKRLYRKLDNARQSYQRAIAEYRDLMAISAQTADAKDPGLIDGNHAMRRAMQVHRLARLQYENALREFTDFVLNGKVPPSQ